MMVRAAPIWMPIVLDIRPAGMGRFRVRFIWASKSASITWLKALEAPTIP